MGSSVVDPKLFFSDPDPDPTLTLISDPDPDSDPDPNMQIISDPAGSGSGCTTLVGSQKFCRIINLHYDPKMYFFSSKFCSIIL